MQIGGEKKGQGRKEILISGGEKKKKKGKQLYKSQSQKKKLAPLNRIKTSTVGHLCHLIPHTA